MNTGTNHKTRTQASLMAMLALAGLCLALTGCSTISRTTAGLIGPEYHPDNFYRFAPVLTDDLRRIAVLPLACDEQRSELVDSRDALESVLFGELVKTKKFEVVKISPQNTQRLSGRERWAGTEAISTNFLASLRDNYGCDAVLFNELTDLHSYVPLAIGWRLKLVDVRSGEILWASDELFNAGQPGVLAGIRRYQRQEQHISGISGEEWAFLNSPRRFGQYSVAQLLNTLPVR